MRGKSEHPGCGLICGIAITFLPFLPSTYLRLTFGCGGKEITQGAFSSVRACGRCNMLPLGRGLSHPWWACSALGLWPPAAQERCQERSPAFRNHQIGALSADFLSRRSSSIASWNEWTVSSLVEVDNFFARQ